MEPPGSEIVIVEVAVPTVKVTTEEVVVAVDPFFEFVTITLY